MSATRRLIGRGCIGTHRLLRRVYAKTYSVGISGAFASFGRRTVLEPPVRIGGEQRISIGDGVYVGTGCWLQTHPGGDGVALAIGDGTSIAGHCVFSAARRVQIGERVLVARGVYISDHAHSYDDTERAVLDQGLTHIEPVEIGDGAWLGENVVITPGVRIGRGAVVGANAVVLEDVPDYSIAVGVPARVVRRFGPNATTSGRAAATTHEGP